MKLLVMTETRNDDGLLPHGISRDKLQASLTEDGRHEAGIFPPIYLAHFSQRFAEEAAQQVVATLQEEGISAETTDLVRIVAPYGLLNIIKGAIDFGYAARVLEEQADLPPFESNPRFTDLNSAP